MRACMDMDDGADTEILSATLKWSKKSMPSVPAWNSEESAVNCIF